MMSFVDFKPPKRFSYYSKLPLVKEAMALEEEYENLLAKDSLNPYEDQLLKYLFIKCNKLWKKVGKKSF